MECALPDFQFFASKMKEELEGFVNMHSEEFIFQGSSSIHSFLWKESAAKMQTGLPTLSALLQLLLVNENNQKSRVDHVAAFIMSILLYVRHPLKFNLMQNLMALKLILQESKEQILEEFSEFGVTSTQMDPLQLDVCELRSVLMPWSLHEDVVRETPEEQTDLFIDSTAVVDDATLDFEITDQVDFTPGPETFIQIEAEPLTPCIKCPLCDFTHSKMLSLSRHIQKHRSHEDFEKASQQLKEESKQRRKAYLQKPRLCPFCHQQFPSLSSQYHHTRFRCAKNPNCLKGHNCEICGTKAASLAALNDHQKTHKKSYDCEECGVSYQKRSSLVSHLRRKHLLGYNCKIYSCDDCGKPFNDRSRYELHLAVHSDLRLAQCEQCGKSFKTNRSMKAHVQQVHLQKFSYNCTQCGHGVDRKSKLRSHKCARVKPPKNVPAENVSITTTIQNDIHSEALSFHLT